MRTKQKLMDLNNPESDSDSGEDGEETENPLKEIKDQYNEDIYEMLEKNEVYGESFDLVNEKAKILEGTINQLISAGQTDSDFFQKLVNAYNQLTSGGEKEAATESLNWITQAFNDLGYAMEESNECWKEMTSNFKEGLTDSIINYPEMKGEIDAVEEDLEKLKQEKKEALEGVENEDTRREIEAEYNLDIRDAEKELQNLNEKADNMFTNLFDNLADQISKTVIGKGVDMFVNWAFAGLGVPTFHEGGFVSPEHKIVEAYKFHTGGTVGANGLKSDEVPAVLQEGEYVMSRDQVKSAGQAGGMVTHNTFNINAVDAKSFADMVNRNPEVIIGAATRDIMRNGNLRKAIKKS
jgi:hypothetical protein